MEKEKFRKLLEEYFVFTRSERRGMMVLCALMLVSVVVRIFAGTIQLEDPVDPALFFAGMEKLETVKVLENGSVKSLFTFDPNTITDSALSVLDIPDKVVSNLKKYRLKGGKFHKPEDIGKLYGMNDSIFQKILPYVSLEPAARVAGETATLRPDSVKHYSIRKSAPQFERPTATSRQDRTVFELNSADSTVLIRLPGIGPVLAGRIIRYRNLLGGFTSVDQLSEVYGMTQERWVGMAERVSVDTSLVKPVRINFAGFQQLSRHPYIRRELAGRIIDWRSANGPVSELSAMMIAGILDSVQFRKLRPYLTCQ